MAKEKFMEIVERLQKENYGKIVLIRIGIFFCGIGKDAVILNNLIKYKPICMQKEICKIGIPVSCFKQVIPRLVETGYSYIVYDYNKEKQKTMEIYRIDGEEIYEEQENIGCEKCWYNKNKLKDTKDYIKELQKLMEKENDE